MLPDRSDRAEDAFVSSWADVDDPPALMEAVEQCIESRRPRLAARLFGLLPDDVEIEPGSPLARARSAARLLLLNRDQAREEELAMAFEDAYRATRRKRMRRIKDRMRRSGTLKNERQPRVGRRTRKR